MLGGIDELRDEIRAEAAKPFDAAAELRVCARPRLTGSAGNEQVAATLRTRFEGLGYQVRDVPFTFSAWPGRYGISVVGIVHVLAALFSGIFLLSGRPVPSLVVLAAALAAVTAIVAFGGRAVLGLRWGRRPAYNQLVTHETERPHYLVMAHRDSKSQLVPLILRWPAIVIMALSWLALLVLSILSLAQPLTGGITFFVALLAVLAGTLLALCWASDDSPGALDNASGLATLIGVAERESARGDVAFLVTDAEELGLAGARAMSGQLPPVFGVINVDGLDDTGPFYVLERFGWPPRGTAPHLALALLSAATALDVPTTRRDVPPGILLDHMPIVQAGTAAVTLMRGERSSMARVHRPGDDLSRLRGDGVVIGVDLVCAALRLLRRQEPEDTRRVARPAAPG
jgi:hypothetical protein